MLKIPSILRADQIPGRIVPETLGSAVPTRHRPPAGGRSAGGFSFFFCQRLRYRALEGHKELLICQWRALPNTSDATLIELLMKGQDVEQVVIVPGDPPHFPAADARLISCVATVAFMSQKQTKKNNNLSLSSGLELWTVSV